jgi:hypothetical protein
MAKIPTPEQLGGLLRMPGSRPTASYAVSPYARGAQQIAEAGAGFGHAIEDVGGAAYKAAERPRMLTQATMASAYINGRLLTTRDRFKSDPDYATLPQRWQDEAGAIVEKGLSLVSNDGLQERVGQEITAPLLQENAAIQHQAFRGAAEANAANREAYLQHLVRHTTLDPNDALTTSATDAYHATIDDAVSRKFLTPEDAAAEKRRAALALCAAHYDVMGRQDPERAVTELQSPDCPHPVAQFLPTETKDALIAHAKDNQQAQQIDAQRGAFLQARQAQRASDEAESTILKDLVSDNPTVTATDIANNGTLTPEARQRMSGAAARTIQPDPPAQVSNAAAVDLIDRIRRPDGDAERIRDLGPFIEILDEQSTLSALLYLVEHVPAKFVRFAELIKAPLGGVAVGRIEARGHHYAQWRGPAKRWCIIGPTGTVVRDSILTKEEAERDVTTRNLPTSMAFVSHPRM